MNESERFTWAQRVLLSCRFGVLAGLLSAFLGLAEAGWIAAYLPEHFERLDRRFFQLAAAYGALGGLIAGGVLLLFPRWGWSWVRVQLIASACALMLFHLDGMAMSLLALIAAVLLAFAAHRSTRVAGASVAGLMLVVAVLLLLRPRFVTGDAGSREVAQARPGNVIFLVIDTLRADHLSSYGYRAPGALGDGRTTPYLDQLAEQSWRFDQAYAQAPWTRPSAASYLTGVYPQSHGISTQFDRLDGATPTLARALRERGYRTVGFSANPQVSYPFGLTQGFERFWNPMSFFYGQTGARALMRHPLFAWVQGLRASPAPTDGAAAAPQRGIANADAESVNRAVMHWADSAPASEKPLFLYIHYLDPHDPYNAPTDELYGDPDSARLRDESILHAEGLVPPRPLPGSVMAEASAEERADLVRRYDTEIRYVDKHIGILIGKLESQGIYDPERDLLVLTSDHGEEFYEHQQWLHGQSLYDEMVRVPLFLRGPGLPSGAVETDAVELVDLFPTVLDWLGDRAEEVHGRSLLNDTRPRGDERIVYSHRPREQHPMDMLRVGSTKLVRVEADSESEVFQLFDLSADPLEQNELLGGGAPEEYLLELLERYRLAAQAFRRSEGNTTELDESMRESLKRLGYLDESGE